MLQSAVNETLGWLVQFLACSDSHLVRVKQSINFDVATVVNLVIPFVQTSDNVSLIDTLLSQNTGMQIIL